MTLGLDASSAQGSIGWPAMSAAGYRFLYAKCCEGNAGLDPSLDRADAFVGHRRATGTTGVDPRFDSNVAGARAAGLKVGAYGFPYILPQQAGNPTRAPEAQAKYFYDKCAGLGNAAGELPPMRDYEWPAPVDWPKWGCTAPMMRQWCLLDLGATAQIFGRKPVLYTYLDFWLAMGGPSEPLFAERAYLMIADYPTPAAVPAPTATPRSLAPWGKDWTFWQFTGGGLHLPNGTPGDIQVFNGDEDALEAFCQSMTA